MKTLAFDYDLENGFAWIEVEGETGREKMTVQCCLDFDPDTIDADDCGHDDGVCGEVNEHAFTFWGENRCMKALFKAAEENGFTVK